MAKRQCLCRKMYSCAAMPSLNLKKRPKKAGVQPDTPGTGTVAGHISTA
jgi:hypothetical protein